MEIKKSQFTISSAKLSQCPKDDKMEFAFIGRSNVGKSSLINMLCNKKGLAKTSATPGKTLLINHFKIASVPTPKEKREGEETVSAKQKTAEETEWYIVDLPGYGFAKRSKKVQDEITEMISSYILEREQMVNVFLLIDVRHDPQKIDLEFMEWLGENGVPFSIVFTKADKLGTVKAHQAASKYLKSLLQTWEELPPHFITSSEKRLGRKEVLDYIEQILHS